MLLRAVLYGIIGWCAEIVWTASHDFYTKKQRAPGTVGVRIPMTDSERWRLQGRTYLWMFPIYAGGALALEPFLHVVAIYPWFVRGVIWCAAIFVIEAVTGLILKRLFGECPWDYSHSRFHLWGVIRWDYAPLWFGFGLLFEHAYVFIKALSPAIYALL